MAAFEVTTYGRFWVFTEDWSRISEVAWYHGAACHVGDTVKSNATLLAKDEKAVKAALKALESLDGSSHKCMHDLARSRSSTPWEEAADALVAGTQR
jgi:hypothetical protein